MLKLRIKTRPTISADQLAALSFILFFAMPFIKRCIRVLFSSYVTYGAIALTYLPVLILLVLCRGKLKIIDCLLLWGGVFLFFVVTYLVHPNYEFWYFREYYGVWDYVLRPDNGIYAYLFIRLIDEPKKILRYLLISAWLMYIHLGYDFLGFLQRGYWNAQRDGVQIRSSYNLEFGYDLLLFELVFLYSALKNKKLLHWVMAALGAGMILAGGSRGPVIDIVIFLVAYFLAALRKSKKKILVISALMIFAVLLYYAYVPILSGLSNLLTRTGLSSRFIRMLIAGTLSDDNGRLAIWQRAWQMILDNPFGYGAMGSRHIIYNLIYVGHPHNVFLEILIDFGVVVGAVIIIAGFVWIIRVIRNSNLGDWQGIALIFLGQSAQLLLSGTFWHRTSIWGLIACFVCISQSERRKRFLHERE